MTSDGLEQRVAALERRVERLEAAPVTSAERQGPDRSTEASSLQLLNRLRERAGVEDHGGPRTGVGDPSGAVAYAGAVTVDDREYLWAKEHQVRDIVGLDWAAAATTLECLGSPARLTLLAALIRAPRSRAQLQEALGETSSGHLYHHLRELQAARLLVQRRRGEYELATHVLVPLLAIVAAAMDLGADEGPAPATAGAETAR
ncbi:helix-turn-helix domain-containing protein [Pseudofrankia sp. BMG5.37]|uniref:helix-turn-helix domain-containing protein n=1 Tax=Pseudofrankia sp. BMG5.37 TaxID=3050035 RepID=UPI0028955201|nr:helix-turn-helix domain-containing protein [Pseudofrankia sp. BMG5.37]MDT3439742.1 helix-turn-helix domain-containing protein [Pseudofrankia sp. BMG5.37]